MRLNHVSYDKIDMMIKNKLVNGLPHLMVNKGIVCAGCQFGKARQLPYEKSNYQANVPLELVHSYVFGPVKQSFMKRIKYMIRFIDYD